MNSGNMAIKLSYKFELLHMCVLEHTHSHGCDKSAANSSFSRKLLTETKKKDKMHEFKVSRKVICTVALYSTVSFEAAETRNNTDSELYLI